MQKLEFEASWDKTLSIKDRKRIEQVFIETKGKNIALIRLWEAVNHKRDLLVTALVHNTGQQVLSFDNKRLRYLENNKLVAEHIFTLPTLTIQPQTSMPWTFIFPIESIRSHAALENGHVEIV
jgi:SLAP domain-containing protein